MIWKLFFIIMALGQLMRQSAVGKLQLNYDLPINNLKSWIQKPFVAVAITINNGTVHRNRKMPQASGSTCHMGLCLDSLVEGSNYDTTASKKKQSQSRAKCAQMIVHVRTNVFGILFNYLVKTFQSVCVCVFTKMFLGNENVQDIRRVVEWI